MLECKHLTAKQAFLDEKFSKFSVQSKMKFFFAADLLYFAGQMLMPLKFSPSLSGMNF
jgi:hypothetical protein